MPNDVSNVDMVKSSRFVFTNVLAKEVTHLLISEMDNEDKPCKNLPEN